MPSDRALRKVALSCSPSARSDLCPGQDHRTDRLSAPALILLSITRNYPPGRSTSPPAGRAAAGRSQSIGPPRWWPGPWGSRRRAAPQGPAGPCRRRAPRSAWPASPGRAVGSECSGLPADRGGRPDRPRSRPAAPSLVDADLHRVGLLAQRLDQLGQLEPGVLGLANQRARAGMALVIMGLSLPPHGSWRPKAKNWREKTIGRALGTGAGEGSVEEHHVEWRATVAGFHEQCQRLAPHCGRLGPSRRRFRP